jgi:hypothetical protein
MIRKESAHYFEIKKNVGKTICLLQLQSSLGFSDLKKNADMVTSSVLLTISQNMEKNLTRKL